VRDDLKLPFLHHNPNGTALLRIGWGFIWQTLGSGGQIMTESFVIIVFSHKNRLESAFPHTLKPYDKHLQIVPFKLRMIPPNAPSSPIEKISSP
jgi:hypothetical protein